MEKSSETDCNSVCGMTNEHLIAVENNLLASKEPEPPTQEVHVNKQDGTSETTQNEQDALRLEPSDELNSIQGIANGERKQLKRCVSFPDESDIVTGFLDPPDPWKNDTSWKTEDLIQAYKHGCEKHNTKPSSKLLQQLQCIDNVGERYEILSFKCEKLDMRQIESLEEIFRLVRFRCLDLEASNLDDETAVALCDMVEYYGTACKLNISYNKNIGPRGWQGISKLIRKTPCLTVIDARNCDVNERIVPLLGRSLRMGCYLTRLQLQNTNLSGRALLILVAGLKMNETLEELFLGDNKFMPTDGVQLGNLLKYNHSLQLLDLRNNHLQDDGVNHVCDGLAEQTMGLGLLTLVLWNNQFTFQAMAAINKALAASESLDTMNLGHNPITNDGIHVLKDGLLKTRSLLKLGMSGTKITCEGAIALAEVIADSPRLIRLDLQENDIKTAGLMALSLALKVNESLTRLDIDRETKKEPGVKDHAEQQRRLQRDIATILERNRDVAYKHSKEKKQTENKKAETRNENPEIIKNSESELAYISYIPSDDKIQRPKLLFVPPSGDFISSPSVDGELRTFSSPFSESCTSPTQSLAVSTQSADILSPQYCNDPKLTAKQLFSVNKWSSPTITSPVTDATYPVIVPNVPTGNNPVHLCQPLESTSHPSTMETMKGIETHITVDSSSESLSDYVPDQRCNTQDVEEQPGENVTTIGHINEVTQDSLKLKNSSMVNTESAGTLDEIVNEMGKASVIEHNETVATVSGCGEGCMSGFVKPPLNVYDIVQDDPEQSTEDGDQRSSQCDMNINTNASISCDSEHALAGCQTAGFEAIEQCVTVHVQSADISNINNVDNTVVISHSNIPGSVLDGATKSDADSCDLNLDAETNDIFPDCATSVTRIDHNYVAVKTGNNTHVELSSHSHSHMRDGDEACSMQETVDNVGRNDPSAETETEELIVQKEIECDSVDVEKWNTVEKSELVQGCSVAATKLNVNVPKPDFFTSMTLNGLKQELASLIDDEGSQLGNAPQ